MTKIYTTESLMGNYKVETHCINIAVEALENMKKIVKKFDGKVLNVRLGNAIDEVISGCTVTVRKNEYDTSVAEIVIHPNERSIFVEDSDGKRELYYAHVFDKTGVRQLKLSGEKQNIINAEEWLKKIDFEIEYFKRTLEKIEINAKPEKIIELLGERQKLVEEIEKFNRTLDFINSNFMRIELRM